MPFKPNWDGPTNRPSMTYEWYEALKNPEFLKVFHNCAMTRKAYDDGKTLAETVVRLSNLIAELRAARVSDFFNPPPFVVVPEKNERATDL